MTESPSSANRVSRILRWVTRHKIRAVLIVIGVYLVVELLTIPWFGIRDLRTSNPTETALMRQRENEASNNEKPLKIRQQWVSLAKLPKYLIDAVIVAEDGTFFTHAGIDWFEVRESMKKNFTERRAARGASTITQQLAKNLYLSTSKTPARKLKELIITLLLERTLSKARILEIYLNIIEWGRGVFGIGAAAQAYFGKSASSLTFDEATRLAAVIPSPLRHRPDDNSRYVLRRKEIVLRRMAARGSSEPAIEDSTDFDEEEENGL